MKELNSPAQSHPPTPESEPSESILFQTRKEKRSRLRESGIEPYPARSELISNRFSAAQIKKDFDAIATGQESAETVNLCGRMMTRRDMGKASFAHIQDFSGQLQIYLRQDIVGEKTYQSFCHDFDLGDIVAAKGKVFRTKTGELSLKANAVALLCKSLRPLPEKWHGLKDVEIRARQRELDLIVNPQSRKNFVLRSQIVHSVRSFMQKRGYIEVETPMMQPVPGGAIARPFSTHHNALDQKFYLRVAPELYLKRCLVGGFEKVFEIGRVFRNEGIDSLHNPEFTILEAYEAYGNMETMLELTEELVRETARAAGTIELPENLTFSAEKPFGRKSVLQLFQEFVGPEESECVANEDWTRLAKMRGESTALGTVHKVFDHILDEAIARHLTEPTFVTEFPASFSPLAKRKEGSEHVAERFELYIGGQEIANAYTELNDPIEQRERMENYRKSRGAQSEDEEAMGTDESFLTALEYGMPPAGGLGIGMDRLAMLFAGQNSLRDVILFPTLKSEK